jgi:hypothetical protein
MLGAVARAVVWAMVVSAIVLAPHAYAFHVVVRGAAERFAERPELESLTTLVAGLHCLKDEIDTATDDVFEQLAALDTESWAPGCAKKTVPGAIECLIAYSKDRGEPVERPEAQRRIGELKTALDRARSATSKVTAVVKAMPVADERTRALRTSLLKTLKEIERTDVASAVFRFDELANRTVDTVQESSARWITDVARDLDVGWIRNLPVELQVLALIDGIVSIDIADRLECTHATEEGGG